MNEDEEVLNEVLKQELQVDGNTSVSSRADSDGLVAAQVGHPGWVLQPHEVTGDG